MKRPLNLSKEASDYIVYLEKQLEKYQSKTTLVNSYHSLKTIVDDLNSIMTDGIELDGTVVPVISSDSLSSKDDKILDRLFKFIDHLGEYNEQLKEMELNILPELKEQEDNFGGDLEHALSDK